MGGTQNPSRVFPKFLLLVLSPFFLWGWVGGGLARERRGDLLVKKTGLQKIVVGRGTFSYIPKDT